MNIIEISPILFLLEIILFMGIFLIIKFIIIKIKNHKLLQIEEYLPIEEIHSLRQISYLILITAFFINIFYSIVFWNTDLIYFSLFDCLLSLYCCLAINEDTWKSKLLIICLIPFGSMTYILNGYSYIGLLDIIHWPTYLYLAKVYYDKFNKYTESNGLGISILLFFILIFSSVFITSYFEGRNLLDSLIMSSNAFTSNGYAVLGNSLIGKINSLFLVWGGYLISGVSTATLTSVILIKNFNKRFDELEEMIKKEK